MNTETVMPQLEKCLATAAEVRSTHMELMTQALQDKENGHDNEAVVQLLKTIFVLLDYWEQANKDLLITITVLQNAEFTVQWLLDKFGKDESFLDQLDGKYPAKTRDEWWQRA